MNRNNKFLSFFKNSIKETSKAPLEDSDVIILTEIARDCKRFGNYMDGADVIAKALDMSYSYVVEYTELEENETEHQCTIGNAVLSKYPIKNSAQLRFKSQCCKYGGRWGGRIAVISEVSLNSSFSFVNKKKILK